MKKKTRKKSKPEPRVTLTLNLPPDVASYLHQVAVLAQMTTADVINVLLCARILAVQLQEKK